MIKVTKQQAQWLVKRLEGSDAPPPADERPQRSIPVRVEGRPAIHVSTAKKRWSRAKSAPRAD